MCALCAQGDVSPLYPPPLSDVHVSTVQLLCEPLVRLLCAVCDLCVVGNNTLQHAKREVRDKMKIKYSDFLPQNQKSVGQKLRPRDESA